MPLQVSQNNGLLLEVTFQKLISWEHSPHCKPVHQHYINPLASVLCNHCNDSTVSDHSQCSLGKLGHMSTTPSQHVRDILHSICFVTKVVKDSEAAKSPPTESAVWTIRVTLPARTQLWSLFLLTFLLLSVFLGGGDRLLCVLRP